MSSSSSLYNLEARDGARRLALFTPLPPSQTGTADYAADLIPELERLVDLRVFKCVPRGFRPEDFDAVAYQIGNNPFHAEIYELALEHPGVVVLHEVNLHYLLRSMVRSEEAYFAEVLYEIFGGDPASRSKDGLLEPTLQHPKFPMLRRLLDRSKACIVHSRFAAEEARLKGFAGRIASIPHGSRVRNLDGSAFRARLRIGPDEPLVGLFGYQRPDKQASACLIAFRNALDAIPEAKLVIAGLPHPEVPLEEQVRELGLENRVHLCGFQTLENLDGYIAACDVVLNLRAPTLGETSGIMMRALGMGKTLIVSDNGANLDLPEEICAKIPVDELQNEVVAECLTWLLSDRKITAEIGRMAQEWVAQNCSWERVARLYTDFLFSPAQAGCGGAAVEMPVGTTSKMLHMIPRSLNEDRILVMESTCDFAPAQLESLGYKDVRVCSLGSCGVESPEVQSMSGRSRNFAVDAFHAGVDPFPYPSHYFQTVVCSDLPGDLADDPRCMMREIHRVLKPEGAILLIAPNAPRPRKWSAADIARLVSDSGFVLLRVESTGEKHLLAHDTREDPRGDHIFALGRKAPIPRR